ncbi:class I adenylate-forming enzyme family protein [Nakamurella aerolata]|uniref:Acyl--CoA ligase n=1 Tax=Nakamurella aerolata TaxID=1656892 RepID=A0A849A6F8_9ACTN|nr:class I adenylate-forming enzyme family protein [Nakamurella aerolata]NNG35013.1 acyl--CoA ligase [Nakamurella aerolata]
MPAPSRPVPPSSGNVASGNIAELISATAERLGDRPALLATAGTATAAGSFSWAQWDQAVNTGAAELLESGLRPGDRVVLALPTSVELAVAVLAVWRAGAVAAPIDPARSDPLTAAEQVTASMIIGRDDGAPGSGSDVAVGAPGADAAGVRRLAAADVSGWWDGSRAAVPPTGAAEDLALLGRVGGRRRPVMLSHRAVLAAVAAITETTGAAELRLDPADRVVQALPMHHVAGLVTSLLPAVAVGTAIVVPDVTTGDWWEDAVPQAIRRHRATVVPGSPATFRALMALPDAERQLASVRLMTSGAAPLRPEDWGTVRERTGQRVWEGYGIAESASVVASTLMTPRPRPRSVGLPLPGVEVRIESDGGPGASVEAVPRQGDSPDSASGGADQERVDAAAAGAVVNPADSAARAGSAGNPAGNPAGSADSPAAAGDAHADADDGDADDTDPADTGSDAYAGPGAGGADAGDAADFELDFEGAEGIGSVGRIAIRGRTLFSGYWPDGSDGPGPDGWFVTTDIGFTDDVGELHLADRAEDAVRIAGFTVYPRDIEAVLIAQPGVAEAIVVGLAADHDGRVVADGDTSPEDAVTALAAVVGTRGSDQADAEELTRRLAELLPAFKRPRALVLVDRVPRTELGRVDRPAAAAQYRDELLAVLAANTAASRAAQAAEAAAAEHSEQPEQPEQSQQSKQPEQAGNDAAAAGESAARSGGTGTEPAASDRSSDSERGDGADTDQAPETVADKGMSGDPSGVAHRSARAGQAVARAASRAAGRAAEFAAELVPERLAERARTRDGKQQADSADNDSADRDNSADMAHKDDSTDKAGPSGSPSRGDRSAAAGATTATAAATDAAAGTPATDREGASGGRDDDGGGTVENLSRTTTPERAANLSQLGRRLPGAGTRRGRTSGDDEDDLFGELD